MEGSGSWVLELGVRDQSLDVETVGGSERGDWLAENPRLIVDVGSASLAVPFEADLEDETRVLLRGFFEACNQFVRTRTYEPGSSTGLDHNLDWRVRLVFDTDVRWATRVFGNLEGTPGCGGMTLPTKTEFFDEDRESLPFADATLEVQGIALAVTIPRHECARPD